MDSRNEVSFSCGPWQSWLFRIYTINRFSTNSQAASSQFSAGLTDSVVRAPHDIADVLGSNPVQAWIFSGSSFSTAYCDVFTAMVVIIISYFIRSSYVRLFHKFTSLWKLIKHFAPLKLSHQTGARGITVHYFMLHLSFQGVRFDPDASLTLRLEFARSNTKVSKPVNKQAVLAPHFYPREAQFSK